MSREELELLILIEDKFITLRDAREVGGCLFGWEAWSNANGFDWKNTLRFGILASDMLKTEDARAEELVFHVYKRDII